MFELTVFFNIEKIGVVFKTWSKLRIKWNFELTVFELAVPDLYFISILNKVEFTQASGHDSFRNFHPIIIFFFGSTLNFYVVAQLSVIVCMFVLLSSITRPGCRDCSRSAAQSEVSHRAKPARPEPPTNRRRTQPTRRPTNWDAVKCHPVQAIRVSPSLPLRYTPVDHSCSFLRQVLYHEYLSPLLKHCDHTHEETITLF